MGLGRFVPQRCWKPLRAPETESCGRSTCAVGYIEVQATGVHYVTAPAVGALGTAAHVHEVDLHAVEEASEASAELNRQAGGHRKPMTEVRPNVPFGSLNACVGTIADESCCLAAACRPSPLARLPSRREALPGVGADEPWPIRRSSYRSRCVAPSPSKLAVLRLAVGWRPGPPECWHTGGASHLSGVLNREGSRGCRISAGVQWINLPGSAMIRSATRSPVVCRLRAG